MDIGKIKLFYLIVKAGSYTAAGKLVGLTQPPVTQAMKSLEKELGCALFTRHKYGVTLTKEGERLYETAKVVINELRIAEDYFKNKSEKTKSLTIATSFGISSDWIIKFLKDFIDINDRILFKIISHPQDVNIDFNEADIAIGSALTAQTHLIQKKLCTFSFKLYASKDYIAKYGKPENKEALKNHRLISFPTGYNIPFSEANSLFEDIENNPPKIEINSSIGEYKLVEEGAGIGILCDQLTIFNREKVIDIFPEEEPFKVDIFYIYHRKTSKIKEIEEFYNFLRENITLEEGAIVKKVA